MTTMIAELYEALIDARATDEKAKEAAKAISVESLNSQDNIAGVKAGWPAISPRCTAP